MNKVKKIIGVTGITGSGTSTVAAILAEICHGIVISADKLAHEAMGKGQEAYDKIVQEFGKEILNENSDINRRVLGSIVFADSKKLKLLESIVHPAVIGKTKDIIAGSDKICIVDAPLLIESEMHKICDYVWLVTASDNVRLQRIMARDGIDEEVAKMRLKNRAKDDILRPYANVIITNNTDLTCLRAEINALIDC